MFRILILILTLFWGQGKVLAQPQNPKHWLIADSTFFKFNNHNSVIKTNFGFPSQYNINFGTEVSSSVNINNINLLGTAFEICIIDTNLNKKKCIDDFRIKYSPACCDDKSTMSVTQGLLFLMHENNLIVIWASYEGGTGQQNSIHWGYTVYKVSGDSLSLVQAPQRIIAPPSFEKCTATRHANGRDWWVMFQRANGNYIQSLFNGTGMLFMRDIVTQNQSTCCGTYPSIGQACFSQTGKWFASTQLSGTLHYFKYNRYNGILNNQQTIYLNPQPYGVNFFNDSVLVYLAQRENPNRCVIATINIFNQIVDTLFDSSGLHYSTLTLAPDGKSILLPKLFTKNIYKITQTGIDTTFYTDLPYVVRGNPPNLPNYELGPDLNPGFTTNLPDTVLCVGQTFTVTDTSWGHFRRMWEWGDGSFSDTLPVKQHWELLGLLDTFRVMNHTFTQPGTYNLTLHIINDSSEFGYMDSTVTKTFVVLPWCQAPVIQSYTDTVCLGAPLTLAAAGDSATYTWTFTNGTASGTQISHIFSESGWNVFSLNVHKFGIDTTLIDSVFVKDCISADFQTEMIPFCDSVIVNTNLTPL